MVYVLMILVLFFTGCATAPVESTPASTQLAPAPVIAYPATNVDDYQPGEGWKLAWTDEFQQAELDTNVWTRQNMKFPYNSEYQQYVVSPETVYVKDGYMVINVQKIAEEVRRTGFTSGRVISNPGGQDGQSAAEGKTFLYGKIAARIQLPYGKGLWPAFWMLGDNTAETGGDTAWPVCGEIDILEAGSNKAPGNGDGTVSGAIHHDPSPGNRVKVNQYFVAGEVTLPNKALFAENFHVFEVEWDAEKIVWKMDGKAFGQISISEETRDEFHKPFYVLFNVAVGGNFTQTPDEDTPFPQFMYVDWIRHYTK